MVSYDCQTHIDQRLIGLIVRGRKKVGETTMKHGEIHVDLDSLAWYLTVIYRGFEHESYRNRGYPPEIGRIYQKDIKDWWLTNPLQHELIWGGFTLSILGHELSRNFGPTFWVVGWFRNRWWGSSKQSSSPTHQMPPKGSGGFLKLGSHERRTMVVKTYSNRHDDWMVWGYPHDFRNLHKWRFAEVGVAPKSWISIDFSMK